MWDSQRSNGDDHHVQTYTVDHRTTDHSSADNDEAVRQATIRRIVELGIDSRHYHL